MKIDINDVNYHMAMLDKNDISYIKSIIDKTLKKYQGLDDYIKKTFKANDINIKKVKDNELVINIFAAFLHSLKDNDNIKNEEQLLKVIKGYVRNYLEMILLNRKEFNLSHPLQYEPKVVSILGLSNYINRELSYELNSELQKQSELTFDICLSWEIINAFRSIKSSMILFTIGDDVHGIALYRGFMEIWSKLLLAQKFKDDYVKYKKYNVNLQMHIISGEELPKDMVDELGKNATNENYIAYGWVKNKSGKRITTLTELMNCANNNDPKVKEFLHYSGEFVHEDYVGIGYNYMELRKAFINSYFEISKAMLDNFGDIFNLRRFNNLYNNI